MYFALFLTINFVRVSPVTKGTNYNYMTQEEKYAHCVVNGICNENDYIRKNNVYEKPDHKPEYGKNDVLTEKQIQDIQVRMLEQAGRMCRQTERGGDFQKSLDKVADVVDNVKKVTVETILSWRGGSKSAQNSVLGEAIIRGGVDAWRDYGWSLVPFFIPVIFAALFFIILLGCTGYVLCCLRKPRYPKETTACAKVSCLLFLFTGMLGLFVCSAINFAQESEIQDASREMLCIVYSFPDEVYFGTKTNKTGQFIGIKKLSANVEEVESVLNANYVRLIDTVEKHEEFNNASSAFIDATKKIQRILETQSDAAPVFNHECLVCDMIVGLRGSQRSTSPWAQLISILESSVAMIKGKMGEVASNSKSVDLIIETLKTARKSLKSISDSLLKLFHNLDSYKFSNRKGQIRGALLFLCSIGIILSIYSFIGLMCIRCYLPCVCITWFILCLFLIFLLIISGVMFPAAIVLGESCGILNEIDTISGWKTWNANLGVDKYDYIPDFTEACISSDGHHKLLKVAKADQYLDLLGLDAIEGRIKSDFQNVPTLNLTTLNNAIEDIKTFAGTFIVKSVVSLNASLVLGTGTEIEDLDFSQVKLNPGTGVIPGLNTYSTRLNAKGYKLDIPGDTTTHKIVTPNLNVDKEPADVQLLVDFGKKKDKIRIDVDSLTCESSKCSYVKWKELVDGSADSLSLSSNKTVNEIHNLRTTAEQSVRNMFTAAKSTSTALKSQMDCGFLYKYWAAMRGQWCGVMVPAFIVLTILLLLSAVFMIPVVLTVFCAYRHEKQLQLYQQ